MNCAGEVKRPKWAELTAMDLMESNVVSVLATAPVTELVRLLTQHRVSGMPVTDATGRVVGVASYRDVLDLESARRGPTPCEARLLADEAGHGRPVSRHDLVVADVMTPAIVDVEKGAGLPEICRTMTNHGVHRVLVTEPGTGRMLGILTSMGVLAAIAEE